MENSPRKPYDGFIGTPAAKALGLVLAFVITFFMMYFGAYSNYCLFVFVGALLFVIPKAFGVKNFKAMLALGIVFFLVTSLVGAFMFTAPTLEDMEDNEITGDFVNYTVTDIPDSDEYLITLNYAGSTPKIVLEQVVETSFNNIYTAKKEAEMTPGSIGEYSYKIGLKNDTIYWFYFTADDKTSEKVLVEGTIESDTIMMTAIKGNMYVNAIPAVMFLLILVFSAWMRKNFEKQRAKFEAEGRLYPKGYGLCKKCGMTVLPGEKVCRRCGEPVDIPEEIQRQTLSKLYGTEKCPNCGNDVIKIEKACPRCKQVMPGRENVADDETFKCSECGADVPANADMCPVCHARFDDDDNDTFKCSECGEIVPGNSEFCPKCGATFDKD